MVVVVAALCNRHGWNLSRLSNLSFRRSETFYRAYDAYRLRQRQHPFLPK